MKEVVSTDSAPGAVGPYSQAVRAGKILFISGQLGIDPAAGILEKGLEAQVDRALRNIKAIVEAAGGGMENICKTTVYLASMEDFKIMNGIYSGYFTEKYPARAAFEVGKLPLGGLVEIEAVAVLE
ncbi:MAG: hypothetical protein JXB45_02635 [Candidatus Krumholzibacteriota bacterium]|nr:hypothetical protein [Candidatus Krumholzibacteriota bacterium]